jgi:hypothetical protein
MQEAFASVSIESPVASAQIGGPPKTPLAQTPGSPDFPEDAPGASSGSTTGQEGSKLVDEILEESIQRQKLLDDILEASRKRLLPRSEAPWRPNQPTWRSIVEEGNPREAALQQVREVIARRAAEIVRDYDAAFELARQAGDKRLMGDIWRKVGRAVEKEVRDALWQVQDGLPGMDTEIYLPNGRVLDWQLINRHGDWAWLEVKFRLPAKTAEGFDRAVEQVVGVASKAGPGDRIVLYSLDLPSEARVADFLNALRKARVDPRRVDIIAGPQLESWLREYLK